MANNSYDRLDEEKTDLRIVLVGKTGVGKSAVGNTILGKRAFKSELSFSSTTSDCEKKTCAFGGLNLAVIDTPGLFETGKSNKDIVREMSKCICMAAPGPHVFLIVLQPTRFTEEERNTVEIIQKMFGEEAAKYTMVLFTHGDLLREKNCKIEDLLEKCQPLKLVISQCSILKKFEEKYHVFDNEVEDSAQVSGLVQKINNMVQGNGGSFYISEIFKQAERAIQEEMERLFTENKEFGRAEARKQAERENLFVRAVEAVVTVGGAAAGAKAGAAVGAVGGPIGAAAGSAVGLLIGRALDVKKNACVIQ